jgi:hypothetical protein
VLERLAAEMIKRRPNRGDHFYGRRGQKQYGLDILEREPPMRPASTRCAAMKS